VTSNMVMGKRACVAGKSISRKKKEVDTNVVSINFDILKDKSALATGDPVFCTNCKAIFNMYSQIEHKEDSQTWICEFCDYHNQVIIDQEEIPKADAMNFILESVVQANENKIGKSENEDISVVFCIDISGSMCVSKPIAGKFKLKGGSSVDVKELMKFSDGSDQHLNGEHKNLTYVSRLQCVQAAIEQQLSAMASSTPMRKVGVVTFNNEVTVIGDSTQQPVTLAGDKLYNYDLILNGAIANAGAYLSKGVKDIQSGLAKKIMAFEEGGSTALGPALLTAVGLASQGKPGSKVVICTDGLANVGLGLLDDEESENKAQSFYEQVGEFAKQNGVCISLISIVGEECQIDTLSTLADLTGGMIQRVDPEHLTENFANILTNEIIATHVSAKVKLHQGLEFRNEEPSCLSEDKSLLVKEIGNVTNETEITFEYSVKPVEELAKMSHFDVSQLVKLPFQTQIAYTTLDGMKCVRVITQMKELTDDKREVEKNADIDILHVNAMQKAGLKAKKGNIFEAQSEMVGWGRKIQDVVSNNYTPHVHSQVAQQHAFNQQADKMFNVMKTEETYKNSTPTMSAGASASRAGASKPKQQDKSSVEFFGMNNFNSKKMMKKE